MHLKTLLTVFLLLTGNTVLLAEVHEIQGHNIQIYKNDIKILKKILQKKPGDIITLERLVKLCFAAEKFSEAVKYSEEYLKIKKSKEILYLRITSLASQSDYNSAIKNIEILLSEYYLSPSDEKLLNDKIKIYKNSISAKSFPPAMKPVSWGNDKVVIGMLYRKSILVGYDYKNNNPFFYDMNNGAFLDNFNDEIFDGLNFRNLFFFSVSPDEREILASVSDGKDSVAVLYKYFNPDKNKWSSWEKISIFNEGSVNNYANFFAGGRRAIFISNRDSGNGLDIFTAEKNTEDHWQVPVKVENVNTILDEPSVLIHPDNETVYFSSNGRGGSGGYDLYGARIVKRENNCAFSDIKNIREINTFRNEIRPPLISINLAGMFFDFSKTGRNFVFRGKIDYLPKLSTFVDIYVLDNETKEALEAEVKLIESSTGRDSFFNNTDKNGYAGFTLQSNKKYYVSLFSEGYVYGSADLEIQSKSLFLEKKYYLSKGRIEKGYSFTADNIYFDTGLSVIREESYPDLERVYDFMVKNPSIKVNISGNTDNVGTYEYNMQLSLERANSIVKYLTNKGISKERMVARGFGFLKSVAPNTTETGRQKNRRVEIEVISSD